MSAGNEHSCALLEDGSVDCWGNNDYGQLGTGDWTSTLIPTAVLGLDAGAYFIGERNETDFNFNFN